MLSYTHTDLHTWRQWCGTWFDCRTAARMVLFHQPTSHVMSNWSTCLQTWFASVLWRNWLIMTSLFLILCTAMNSLTSRLVIVSLTAYSIIVIDLVKHFACPRNLVWKHDHQSGNWSPVGCGNHSVGPYGRLNPESMQLVTGPNSSSY